MMNAKKIAALTALLQSSTIREAAEKAGIDESTMRRYLRESDFRRAYDGELADRLRDASRQAQNGLKAALDVLIGICTNGEENAQTRISAARSLLDFSIKLRAESSVEERLRALEDATQKCSISGSYLKEV